jgi:hypothetical protein
MKSTKLLVVMVVLQSLVLLGQWTSSGPVTPARAQIPDGGAQRNLTVDELKALNGRVDKLIGLLESGKVMVRVAPPEDKK